MQGKSRWIGRLVVGFIAAGVTGAVAEPKEASSLDRANQRGVEKAPVSEVVFKRSPTDVIKFFPVPEDAKHVRLHAGGESGAVAGIEEEVLIYSATLGKLAAQVPPFQLVADDITYNAAPGCALRRYTFQVIGKADPTGTGGDYTVDYALYDNCPGVGGVVIEGTARQETIPAKMDSVVFTIPFEVLPEQSILLPCSVWLGVKTSRSNVGIIMGAPASVGFSEDILDFPGFPCSANIGGFPSFGHATFNAEIFGDSTCSPAFLGYRNANASRGVLREGANVWMADDLELGVQGCRMVAYEVGIKDRGFYTFELRRNAGGIPGAIISGTRRLFVNNDVQGFSSECFFFTTPISLDTNVWMTFKVGNDNGGWVLTDRNASWGNTLESYAVQDDQGIWSTKIPPFPLVFGGFYTIIHCAGEPPVGACCDIFLTDDEGEAVCRDLPEMNCPFPPRGTTLRPFWRSGVSCRVCSHGTNEGLPCSDIADCLGSFCVDDGVACETDVNCATGTCEIATCDDNDPFLVPCGVAACCKPEDAVGGSPCENITRNQCFAVEPIENPRQWQLGRFCGSQGQRCPNPACLARRGDCLQETDFLCEGGPLDGEVCEEDRECLGYCNFDNMTCVGGTRNGEGCTDDSNCPAACDGGLLHGFACEINADCPDGVCRSGVCRGICVGGTPDLQGLSCIAHATCHVDCLDGTCIFSGAPPGVCNRGDRDGTSCFSNRDCLCTTCECQAGCERPLCCTDVCEVFDSFCCSDCWDATCAQVASAVCPIQAENDTCAPEGGIIGIKGARLVKIGESVETDASRADKEDLFEPGFCCNTGPRRRCIGGGDRDDLFCESNDDCLCGPNDISCDGFCSGICVGGDRPGEACIIDDQCTPGGFCEGSSCVGGAQDGQACDTNDDCPPNNGFCPPRVATPEARALHTVWYRFEIPERTLESDPEFVSVQLSTCPSNAPAEDSVLQVFSIPTSDIGVCEDLGRCSNGIACNVIANNCKDGSNCFASPEQCSVSDQDCPAETRCVLDLDLACENLSLIGCNDDADSCGVTQKHNSRICLSNLKRGRTYFAIVGVKEPEAVGTYRFTITGVSSCVAGELEINDDCDNAAVATEGVTPFDLNQTTFSCPREFDCVTNSLNDVWFTYTPERSGKATLETCGPNAASTPDTDMVIYDECVCPPPEPLVCPIIGEGDCLLGSTATIEVNAGQCYLIRIGDNQGGGGSGDLTIALELPDCNNNGITDDCEIDCNAGGGSCSTVPGCGTAADCNGNSIPDDCETEVTCCPPGLFTWINPPVTPPAIMVDARYPFLPTDTSTPLGPKTIQVQGPAGADPSCWTPCDTFGLNPITNVTENSGTYTIELTNPVAIGGCITITYTDDAALQTTATFTVHPGNVNGDLVANEDDVLALIDILNGSVPMFGDYSAEIDRSSVRGPIDILAVIDMLNGTPPFARWLDTLRPDCSSCTQ